MPSLPHIAMTVAMLRERGVEVDDSRPDRWAVSPGPIAPRDVVVEPDLSNAAPFLAAAAVTGGIGDRPALADGHPAAGRPAARHPGRLRRRGRARADAGLTVTGTDELLGTDLDLSGASELTPVVAALAALARDTSHIRGRRPRPRPRDRPARRPPGRARRDGGAGPRDPRRADDPPAAAGRRDVPHLRRPPDGPGRRPARPRRRPTSCSTTWPAPPRRCRRSSRCGSRCSPTR